MDFRDYDTRLAAYAALVDEQDRILLTWFNGVGVQVPCWTVPGGGVEFNESLQDAVVREVREETGYLVEVGELLAIDDFTVPAAERAGRALKSVRFVFRAQITGGLLGTTEVNGSTDFAERVPRSGVAALDPKADIIDVTIAALGAFDGERSP